MSPIKTTTVAIVGAGFSGTATALNLMSRMASTPITVYLIDSVEASGKGLAYATEDDNLVLNVPSGNMSLYADRPDDFLDYCRELDSSLNSGSFMFRRVYGEYLRSRVDQAKVAHPGKLIEINDRVIALSHAQQFILTLGSGSTLQVDQVVLAFGHFAPRKLSEIFSGSEHADVDGANLCVENPWDICAIDRLPLDKDVLIVGTGHTAIDTLFRLVSVPAPRKIYLVSRHGHAPNGHRKAGEFVKLPPLTVEIEETVRTILRQSATIRSLFSAIRKLSRQHSDEQGNWRNVINSLRQITPEIWQALPLKERARFLRHVVHHWDVLRHRLAPVAIRRLQGLIAAGKVEIIAGRVRQISATREVEIQLRGTQVARTIAVGAVVNCTGPNYDIHRVKNPLVQQLAQAGWLVQDDVKIGFAVDAQYRSSALPGLFYIGPMLKARYWEAIAVPELRLHAQKLTTILLDRAA